MPRTADGGAPPITTGAARRSTPPGDWSALSRPLPWSSPRAWRFAALAAASRAGATVSAGLAIGYRHGFDSGLFMEHVYANTPRGTGPLGRAVDRRLLGRPTCEAFRDISALARQAVTEAIDAVSDRDAPVVADLAAGPSPYLLEAIATRPGVRAVLRDVDPAALEAALAGARRLGVADRVHAEAADAFDADALAALAPRPDVVLECGLYGMYPDDDLIARHFHDLAERVGPRQIVCNVQTANPEIEYIARVWRNRHGEPCVWRLRPVEAILRWAGQAGYAPASVTADRHGIYRVLRLERAPGG